MRISFEISILEFIQKAYGFVIFANNLHTYTAVNAITSNCY